MDGRSSSYVSQDGDAPGGKKGDMALSALNMLGQGYNRFMDLMER